MSVRIVSYNIFAPVYADRPEHYFKCQPEFLKTDYRWNLIRDQLEHEIVNHKNTIICLQEVSLTLIPDLELFFRRLNYSFFHNLYGQMRNDYMGGIAMAIPITMRLNSMSIIRIGDRIRSMMKLRSEQTTSLPTDLWEIAASQPHTFICLQLVINDKQLSVGTYHMPCLYKQPDVMLIHSSIIKDLMFELAAGQNFILAGDFNFKPRDICYKYLIKEEHVDCNLPESAIEQKLKSAYREKNGSEPVYTDFSHKCNSERFCETLDYIFYNGHLTVDNVLQLPDQPTSESYPDQTHPSDHLMIAATFRLL
ncbi:unnamed protein product [Adineta ricciae]|uniref:Endonuclease/exonuclease/phosphatase domain-containing protein n=1 Tax=Adineta ricciae TaxID=249248 RepID=A0A815WK74_ADIRI|nr:unnamed protein product [Adineta ricciae]CAF1643398.1 unnamed protein product [Adineta ricciae]